MSELILHQYAMSPFSEKIRAMLGYTGQSWRAVTVREMPPRPNLVPLADGYRKIPVAQIGADIFCDTRTISREIARMTGKPELALENNSQEVQDFVRQVDLEIFLACIVASGGGGLLIKLIRNTSLIDAYKFLKDRIEMAKKSRVKSMSPKQAKARVAEHVSDLERRLDQDFLFGDRPCIADFSTYHGLWFVCDVAEKDVLGNAPRVRAWMDRIRRFGHGTVEQISAEEALEIAHARLPRPLPSSRANDAIGQTVRIAPDDYGRIPVKGTLVADDGESWVVAHEHPRVGTVNIHVPQQGFSLK
ncbi:glutathione S-transferase family protein [Marinobacter nanhaiticus D15-8W]|uniref:Glutathione S-transferase family protein n=1 Tax=Marinobacter nanhaiticus D15-8W TaxID=626887 RepID=N6WXL4_9GAMM|nr:glutathione S-transferase family protein [Marinobacter nanhaiticus]ENO16336.1 glutathione S-transferase family protein [Marinobacter nanhaiticus D15-8W]BES72805.1 glutathione S-transferase family protein [Marinobacter nanhaiticus D15-8W]